MHPLIQSAELRNRMASATPPVLLDCSFDLADPDAGEQMYRQAHLPGAHPVHLDRDLAAPKNGTNGRHPLRDRASYARWMGALGIAPGVPVIAYDRQGSMFAVRAWWILRWMGHADAAVLDGGLPAWQRDGGEVTPQRPPPPVATADYPGCEPHFPMLTADELQARLGQVQVIDARAPERYRGEVEPLDAVAGHIPGAVNRFFQNNLQADGRFKPADVLRKEFGQLLDGRAVVHQCGSGVTACHNLLAMEVAGLPGAAIYPGSWSEWSSNPSRPMTTL